MDHTPHIFLAGPEAEAFAQERGLELVGSNEWFTTEQRKQQWIKCMQKGTVAK